MLLRVSGIALWAYLCLTLVWGAVISGRQAGAGVTALVFAAGAALILAAPGTRAFRRRVSASRMAEVGTATIAVLLTLFAAESVFAVYQNAERARAATAVSAGVRERDRNVWHGELFPRLYFPTDADFQLHKPNTRLTGEVFGEFYAPAMLASPVLADSVLERRTLSYFIGPHGFRELEPLGASRIFALGDSFVLGYATDEGRTWTDLLGARLGEPVYNLGISASGPRAQLSLLKYLLETQPDSVHIGHLLWMIFEGNDLENSYAEMQTPSAANARDAGSLLDGTVIQALASLPGRARNQSVLRKLLRGELRLGSPTARTDGPGRYLIDGVRLELPLFHSERLGYMMFNRSDLERATKGPEYVLGHPNRPLLEATFDEMLMLSERHGFRVTVIVAPSAARLHGPAFDGFPRLSERPHFVDFLVDLSRKCGFPVINLLDGLAPFAVTERLYYRDDHHWNERGNAVVAGLVEAAIRGAR